MVAVLISGLVPVSWSWVTVVVAFVRNIMILKYFSLSCSNPVMTLLMSSMEVLKLYSRFFFFPSKVQCLLVQQGPWQCQPISLGCLRPGIFKKAEFL